MRHFTPFAVEIPLLVMLIDGCCECAADGDVRVGGMVADARVALDECFRPFDSALDVPHICQLEMETNLN